MDLNQLRNEISKQEQKSLREEHPLVHNSKRAQAKKIVPDSTRYPAGVSVGLHFYGEWTFWRMPHK